MMTDQNHDNETGLQSASTCFITGGSGYIGRNLIKALVADGYRVRALARSDASAGVVERLGADPVHGDLMDAAALRKGMTGANVLIHAAADTNHGASTREQDETNLAGTRLVYETAQACGISKAIHLSTEAVLVTGNPLENADEAMPYPKKFAGGYSRTKALSEQIALQHSNDGLEVIVIRPRFVWGRDDTTALPQLIEAAKTGKLAWIDGGRYMVSSTHIDNLCHGLLLSLKKGRGGEVYFITDGEPVEFRGFVTDMLECQGVEAPTKEMPRGVVKFVVQVGELFSKISGGKLSGPMSWQEYATLGNTVTLNIEKARSELGYVPIMSRQSGMDDLKSRASNA